MKNVKVSEIWIFMANKVISLKQIQCSAKVLKFDIKPFSSFHLGYVKKLFKLWGTTNVQCIVYSQLEEQTLHMAYRSMCSLSDLPHSL